MVDILTEGEADGEVALQGHGHGQECAFHDKDVYDRHVVNSVGQGDSGALVDVVCGQEGGQEGEEAEHEVGEGQVDQAEVGPLLQCPEGFL